MNIMTHVPRFVSSIKTRNIYDENLKEHHWYECFSQYSSEIQMFLDLILPK